METIIGIMCGIRFMMKSFTVVSVSSTGIVHMQNLRVRIQFVHNENRIIFCFENKISLHIQSAVLHKQKFYVDFGEKEWDLISKKEHHLHNINKIHRGGRGRDASIAHLNSSINNFMLESKKSDAGIVENCGAFPRRRGEGIS